MLKMQNNSIYNIYLTSFRLIDVMEFRLKYNRSRFSKELDLKNSRFPIPQPTASRFLRFVFPSKVSFAIHVGSFKSLNETSSF